jgi:hypothetical protein
MDVRNIVAIGPNAWSMGEAALRLLEGWMDGWMDE